MTDDEQGAWDACVAADGSRDPPAWVRDTFLGVRRLVRSVAARDAAVDG